MNLLKYLPEILFGQIPEAIFFALFMIYTKRLKEHRFKFIILMIIEYTLIMETIRFDIYAHLLVFIMTFIILKLLYKEKAQVIDIFTFGIASIVLMTISIVSYLIVWKLFNNYFIALIINRTLLFLFILVFKNKLNKIQDLYKKIWNRDDNITKKMKTTTFRALNVVVFNFMFFIINLCMNMFYNDYKTYPESKRLDINEFCLEMTKLFINDSDAPKYKTEKYFKMFE